MSSNRETTRIVRSWLDEGATHLPDRVLDAVLDQVPSTRQRRARWWRVWAAEGTGNRMTATLAFVVLVLAAVLGLNLVSDSNVGGPSLEVPPDPSPVLLPFTESTTSLDAGLYELRDFPVVVRFDVPAGWSTCSASREEQGVCTYEGPGPSVAAAGFQIIDNVVADPCGDALRQPPVGPSVEDLVAALSSLDGFSVDGQRDVTVGGFRAKELALTAPRDSPCLGTWVSGGRSAGVGPGERNLLRIVDVAGTRVVLSATYHPGETPPRRVAEVLAILDSMWIEKP